LWGVQLDIPIFQSGARSAKVSQAKIQLDKLAVADQQLKAGLNIRMNTVRSNFLNSWKIYQNRKKGLDLSYKIYDKTRQKLQEGVSSTIELQQNYNQYLDSESQYVMAIMEMLNYKLELEEMLTEFEY
jgi:outer membrane protein TolC